MNICYLGSLITADSNCDKKLKITIGKGKCCVWVTRKDMEKQCSIMKTTICLYDAKVLSTQLHRSETWKNWPETIRNDLRCLEMSWDEAE